MMVDPRIIHATEVQKKMKINAGMRRAIESLLNKKYFIQQSTSKGKTLCGAYSKRSEFRLAPFRNCCPKQELWPLSGVPQASLIPPFFQWLKPSRRSGCSIAMTEQRVRSHFAGGR